MVDCGEICVLEESNWMESVVRDANEFCLFEMVMIGQVEAA